MPLEPFSLALANWKRNYFLAALDEAHGHQGAAAELIGVHPNTMNRLLRESGLTRQIIRQHRLAQGKPTASPRIAQKGSYVE